MLFVFYGTLSFIEIAIVTLEIFYLLNKESLKLLECKRSNVSTCFLKHLWYQRYINTLGGSINVWVCTITKDHKSLDNTQETDLLHFRWNFQNFVHLRHYNYPASFNFLVKWKIASSQNFVVFFVIISICRLQF